MSLYINNQRINSLSCADKLQVEQIISVLERELSIQEKKVPLRRADNMVDIVTTKITFDYDAFKCQHSIADARYILSTFRGEQFIDRSRLADLKAAFSEIWGYTIGERVENAADDGKESGKKSGEARREKAAPTKEAWQAEAEKIWRKHPAWKNRRVAADIEKKIGGKADYIRHHIKKPLL